MNIMRIVIAVVAGVLVGGAVNMGLIMLGSQVIPAPQGVDVTNAESIANHLHLFEPKHFLTPFLAHALGTLAGALVAHLIATDHRNLLAYVVGGIFFAGGIAAATLIPAPIWFIVVDLVLAYFPMAVIAIFLGNQLRAA